MLKMFDLNTHYACAVALGDPWRDATISAVGISGTIESSQNIGLSNGFHCSDLITNNGLVDSTVLAVQKQGLAAIETWLQ